MGICTHREPFPNGVWTLPKGSRRYTILEWFARLLGAKQHVAWQNSHSEEDCSNNG